MKVFRASNVSNIESESSSAKSLGRWTKDEHERFVEGIKLYGKNWKLVEDHIGTRNGAQIRSHAQKFFHRLKRDYNVDINTNSLSSEGSDLKTLEEKLKVSRNISDASQSTALTSRKMNNDKTGGLEAEPSDLSGISAEKSEALSLESFKNPQEQQKCVADNDDEAQKILDIYNSARRYLGLPENEFDPCLTTPFSKYGWQAGYFINLIKANQLNQNALQSTKLSDLVSFSDISKESSSASNAPERSYSRNGFKKVKLISC